jgi:DNA-binding IclR family transcriptional regulator
MGISFPVFNSDGTLTGVLCLSGISERMTDAAVQKAVPYLRGQAQRLGKMLDGLTIRT